MFILLLLFVVPLAILGIIIWAFMRGSHTTKIITSVVCAALLVLSLVPRCTPLDLSKEDNSPITGELQGAALQTYLERNSANGISTHQWEKKSGTWYECWSGASVLTKFYGTFYGLLFTEPEDMSQKVLIQTK